MPPKYTSADFLKTVVLAGTAASSTCRRSGSSSTPTPGASTDPTPLLGWAGWDHAQQALALATIIGDREAEGWPDERLIPLVAGLAELLPWVEQWHAEIDPLYGVSLGRVLPGAARRPVHARSA